MMELESSLSARVSYSSESERILKRAETSSSGKVHSEVSKFVRENLLTSQIAAADPITLK